MLTGADLAADGVGDLPTDGDAQAARRLAAFATPRPALARERVRHVGDPVALVVAETPEQAIDAAELVAVDYEPLPAIAAHGGGDAPGRAAGLGRGARQRRVRRGRPASARRSTRAFESAAHVDAPRLRRHPRGGRADGAARRRRRVRPPHRPLHAAHRHPGAARLRTLLAERAQGAAEPPPRRHRRRRRQLRHAQRPLSRDGARAVGGEAPRPAGEVDVGPARGLRHRRARPRQRLHRRAGARPRRHVPRAARCDHLNVGAYLTPRSAGPGTNNIGGVAGVYTTPAIHVQTTGVFTNTTPTGPYRGAGRPEATYAIERVIDVAARELGIDPLELRRRNLIPSSAMPFKTGLVFTYDCGDFARGMDMALRSPTARVREAARRGAAARRAARPRHRQPHRGRRRSLHRGQPRHRADLREPRRLGLGVHRLDVDGAGQRDRVRPDRERRGSACRPSASRCSGATPTRSAPAAATAARARSPSAAPP